jgi:hypothetical protein
VVKLRMVWSGYAYIEKKSIPNGDNAMTTADATKRTDSRDNPTTREIITAIERKTLVAIKSGKLTTTQPSN